MNINSNYRLSNKASTRVLAADSKLMRLLSNYIDEGSRSSYDTDETATKISVLEDVFGKTAVADAMVSLILDSDMNETLVMLDKRLGTNVSTSSEYASLTEEFDYGRYSDRYYNALANCLNYDGVLKPCFENFLKLRSENDY